MTLYETNLHEMAAHCAPDINLAAASARLIGMAPESEQPGLFLRFLYEFRYTPTDRAGSVYEEFGEDPEEEIAECVRAVEGFMRSRKDPDLSEEEYHRILWNFLRAQAEGGRKMPCLLMACAMAEGLPYIRKTDMLTMTQEEFEKEEDKIDPLRRAMIRHIGCLRLSQITENASMLLPIIESGKDEREKTILLSLALMMLHSRIAPPSLLDLLADDGD